MRISERQVVEAVRTAFHSGESESQLNESDFIEIGRHNTVQQSDGTDARDNSRECNRAARRVCESARLVLGRMDEHAPDVPKWAWREMEFLCAHLFMLPQSIRDRVFPGCLEAYLYAASRDEMPLGDYVLFSAGIEMISADRMTVDQAEAILMFWSYVADRDDAYDVTVAWAVVWFLLSPVRKDACCDAAKSLREIYARRLGPAVGVRTWDDLLRCDEAQLVEWYQKVLSIGRVDRLDHPVVQLPVETIRQKIKLFS